MQRDKSSSLKIGMILDGNYPQDIRVRKEAESLAKHHSVFILCCRNKDEKEYEEIEGVHVHRLVNYRNNIEKGLIDIALAINFVHPYFSREIDGFIKNNHLDVLHVHDLPLAKTGQKAGLRNNLRLVLDLHENYAAALSTWFLWRKSLLIKWKNQLFFSYKRWAKYESKYLLKYDKIIAVVEEMKERIQIENQIDSDRITVVTNSEKRDFVDNFQLGSERFFPEHKDEFTISYVGGFGPHRGLHTAIEGMKYVVEKIPKARLNLVGPSSKDVRQHLIDLVERFDLHNHVTILGRQPFENVIKIMKGSDVNIIPHVSNKHTDSTIPHKLYQILLSGKPLLVSDCAPMKRIVNDYDIGTVFMAGQADSFADKIIQMYNEPTKTQEKAERGYQHAYHGELNWEHTSKELLKLYESLIN